VKKKEYRREGEQKVGRSGACILFITKCQNLCKSVESPLRPRGVAGVIMKERLDNGEPIGETWLILGDNFYLSLARQGFQQMVLWIVLLYIIKLSTAFVQ
jgi:hypothetical protein